MKVLLVNPDYEIERYTGRHFGRMGWVMPPMGLLYLAAQLEAEGIEVSVYDAQVEERPLDEVLTSQEPAIVGITCASALVGSTLAAARMNSRSSSGEPTSVSTSCRGSWRDSSVASGPLMSSESTPAAPGVCSRPPSRRTNLRPCPCPCPCPCPMSVGSDPHRKAMEGVHRHATLFAANKVGARHPYRAPDSM